jgi:hypothetical protein
MNIFKVLLFFLSINQCFALDLNLEFCTPDKLEKHEIIVTEETSTLVVRVIDLKTSLTKKTTTYKYTEVKVLSGPILMTIEDKLPPILSGFVISVNNNQGSNSIVFATFLNGARFYLSQNSQNLDFEVKGYTAYCD